MKANTYRYSFLGTSIQSIEWISRFSKSLISLPKSGTIINSVAISLTWNGDVGLFRTYVTMTTTTLSEEYPAFPEEAFQRTGTNVFALDRLSECYEPINGARGRIELRGQRSRFIEDRNGPLKLFHWPGRDSQYVIGADPSYTTEGDQACIQVLNRRTFEQVAVWHGKIDAVHFADEIVALAMYFNRALINVEIEGPGYATIASIVRIGYPNIWQHRWADRAQGKVSNSLGWSTTFNRKHWAIGDLKWAISDASITIHDSVTYNQMRNYVVKPNGELGNNSNVGYDDSVMAMAIALITAVTEGPPARPEAPEPDSLISHDMIQEYGGF